MNISSYVYLLTKTTIILKRIFKIYYSKVNYEYNWFHEFFVSISWDTDNMVQRMRIQYKPI